MSSRKDQHYRRKRRTVLMGGLEPQYRPDALLEEMPGLVEDANPFERIDARVDVERLLAQEALTPRQRQAIQLIFWEGLTEAEAAKVMAIQPGPLHRLKYRALARLRARAQDKNSSAGG